MEAQQRCDVMVQREGQISTFSSIHENHNATSSMKNSHSIDEGSSKIIENHTPRAAFGIRNHGTQLGFVNASHGVFNFGKDHTTDDEARRTEATRIKCLRSLFYQQMRGREDNIKHRTPGTCTWILKNDNYCNWLSNQGLLWIKGKPGSGKSTILKFMVDESIRPSDVPNKDLLVASFFFHAGGTAIQRTSKGLYRALLYQIFRQNNEVLDEFISSHESRRAPGGITVPGLKWHENELQVEFEKCILKILDKAAVRIYIDALDECDETSAKDVLQLFQGLRDMSRSKPNAFGICISCRPYPSRSFRFDYVVKVDEHNSKDIDTCINYNLKSGDVRKTNRLLLEKDLSDKASGSFQWVDLVVPRIVKNYQDGDGMKSILEEISKTPQELNVLYEQITADISEEELPRTCKLLQWICFAIRPLSLDELRFAVHFQEQSPFSSIQECVASEDVCKDADQMERRMRKLTRGLVEVKEQENQRFAQFIHQSVNEYMLRSGLQYLNRRLRPESLPVNDLLGLGHHDLSRSCLRYLLMQEIQQLSNREKIEAAIGTQFPFLEYATSYWIIHAEKAEENGISQENLLEYLEWPSNEIVSCWTKISTSMGKDSYPSPTLGETILHTGARHRLESIVREILITESLCGKYEKGGTSIRAHREVTNMHEGGDARTINNQDEEGRTAIFNAAMSGALGITTFLFNQGADLTLSKNNGCTPLHAAAYYGHLEVVKLLLQKGADLIVKANNRLTPLHYAAYNGHVEVVKLLLEHKADVLAIDDNGCTPLHAAAYYRHFEVVKLLLQKEADITVQDDNGWTPLHAAAHHGHLEVVKLLLQERADLTIKDYNGWTPLHATAYNGHVEVVKLLLEHKADVLAIDDNGCTPLHAAAHNGHPEVVKLLLDNGVDPVTMAEHWQTLIYTARNGHHDVVEMLLDAKCQVDIPTGQMYSTLCAALAGKHRSVVDILRAKGACIDFNVVAFSDLITTAARLGSVEYLRIFCEQVRKHPKLKDRDGKTLFCITGGQQEVDLACHTISEERAIALIDRKEDTAPRGTTSECLTKIVRQLLHLFNLQEMSSSGWSPLHLASRTGDIELIQLLAAAGLSANSVQTLEPRELWTPYAIAVYHRNARLIADTGTASIGAMASSLTQVQLSWIISRRDLSFVTEGASQASVWCSSCFHDIYGPRFKCRSCKNVDYCFMCKLTAPSTHPGHEWETIAISESTQ